MKRFLAAAALAALLCASTAHAAVTPNSVVTPQTPKLGLCQFLQGTDVAGTYKTCYTAGADGSKCFAIWESNNDGSATHLITVQIVRSAVKYGGVAVTTAVNDGSANGVPAKNFMSSTNWPGLPVDSDSNTFFYLQSGDTVQATYATALTSTTTVNLAIPCADF